MKPKPLLPLKNFTVPVAFSPVSSLRGHLAAPVNQRKAQRLSFRETFQSRSFDLTDMDEDVFAATVLHDEAKALLRIEKFDRPRAFTDDLIRHAAAPSGAARITVRSRVSFNGRAVITLISIEVFVAEAIAFVPASASPVSIKTHS